MTTSNRDAAMAGNLGDDVLTIAERAKPATSRPTYCTVEALATTVKPLDFATDQEILDAARALEEACAKVDREMPISTWCGIPFPERCITWDDYPPMVDGIVFPRGTSAVRLSRPLLVGHAPPFTGTDEERDAALAALADAGVTVLPPGAAFEFIEPAWPNPSSMEPGQVWDFNDFGCADGRYVVTHLYEIGCANLRADRGYDGACVCAMAIADPKHARCVGYELPNGSRVMVGEYRVAALSGRLPWRVSAILDGARVLLAKPGFTMELPVADVAARAVVPEGAVGPVTRADAGEREAYGVLWCIALRPVERGQLVTMSDVKIASSDPPVAAVVTEAPYTINTPEDADRLFGAHSEMAGRVRDALTLLGASITLTDTKIAVDSLDATTMRAECSAADVTQGEQSRAASPPSADCGPGILINDHATPGRRAMAAMGWKILDE